MESSYWTGIRRRQVNRRRFLAGTMTAAGAAFVAACGGSEGTSNSGAVATQAPGGSPAAQGAATPAPRGGTLTSTIVGTDAKSFHTGQTTDSPSATYQGYIYGGGSLHRYHEETLEIIPDGAEKWTVSDDKRTFTFTLKDVKWSDSTPVTATDYAWTYEQLKNPANKYPYVTNFDAIESYTAVDPKTLRITMKEAIAIGLENANVVTPLPKHIWEKLDWGDPVKNPEIQNPTISNGLWKLKEWKKDNFVTFVANDTYFEGRPNVDQLTVRVFGTQALAYQALKSGEVDWSGFQQSDYKEAKSLSNINVYEWYAARGAWSYIGFNFRRKPLQDVNVRRAIAYATDRKGIIEGLAYGLGRPTYSVFPESSWVYNPNVEKYDFDPKKSADLFKAAGYSLQNRKLIKDGQELKLKVLYNTGNPVREGVATIMQQQLQDLGCSVDVQGMEFQSYLDAIKTEPFDYDLFVLGWNATVEPHFMKQIWTERAIPSLNSGAYVNKRVEDLFEQGGKEFDRDKRKSIYGEIQKILADELPYVFLYEGLSYTGVNKKVGGIKPAKTGIGYNMNEWYITR